MTPAPRWLDVVTFLPPHLSNAYRYRVSYRAVLDDETNLDNILHFPIYATLRRA